jgi:hypothetical protein
MKKNYLLVLILFASLSFYGQNDNAQQKNDWKKIIVDNSISLSAPFEMKSINLEIEEGAKQKIDKYITYSGQDKTESFVVMAISAMYKPPIEVNLDGALIGSMNGFKTSDINVHYDQKSISAFGIKGISAIGYYEDTTISKKTFFEDYFFGKGNKYWNVLILYATDNQENKDMAKRVYDSVEINSN